MPLPLPPEVFAMVLEAYCESPIDAIFICQLDSATRALAISLPSLWSTISINIKEPRSLEFAEYLMANRIGQASSGVSLTVESVPSYPYVSDWRRELDILRQFRRILNFVLEAGSKLRALSLTVGILRYDPPQPGPTNDEASPRAVPELVETVANLNAPNLRVLQVHTTFNHAPLQLICSSPSLLRLSVLGLQLKPGNIQFGALTSLTLDETLELAQTIPTATYRDWLGEILRACPCLQRLRCRDLCLSRYRGSEALVVQTDGKKPITLDCLVYLQLRGDIDSIGNLLSRLQVPALEELEIKVLQNVDTFGFIPLQWSEVYNIPLRSNVKIIHLAYDRPSSISDELYSQHWRSLVESCPSVEELQIQFDGIATLLQMLQDASFGCGVTSLIMEGYSMGASRYLEGLERLVSYARARSAEEPSVFHSMTIQRFEPLLVNMRQREAAYLEDLKGLVPIVGHGIDWDRWKPIAVMH